MRFLDLTFQADNSDTREIDSYGEALIKGEIGCSGLAGFSNDFSKGICVLSLETHEEVIQKSGIVLCLLVVGVESCFWIGRRSIRVVSVAIIVIVLAKRLFNFFELLICVHVQIATQVFNRIGFKLVDCRSLAFRRHIFDSLLDYSTFKCRYLKQEAEKLVKRSLQVQTHILVPYIEGRNLGFKRIFHHSISFVISLTQNCHEFCPPDRVNLAQRHCRL